MRWRCVLLSVVVLALLLVLGAPALAGGGFDEYGYNRKARVFVGTATSWCADRVARGQYPDIATCLAKNGMTPYANDRLIMKWNAEWDRGNAEGWSNSHYDAWENNEWNGMFPGGSGSVWHYNIAWVGPCGAYGTPLPDGGYCIWGQFEVLMDHGLDPNMGPGHIWFAHATPAGYGAH